MAHDQWALDATLVEASVKIPQIDHLSNRSVAGSEEPMPGRS